MCSWQYLSTIFLSSWLSLVEASSIIQEQIENNNTNLQNNTSGEQWIDLCGGIQELYVVNPSKVSYTNAGRGSYIHINPSAGLDGTTTARFEAGKEYGWQNS